MARNRRNTKDAALLAMMSGNTVCLRGETGVGKTDMMRQIAEESGRELIVLDAAIQSTEDLIGYPYRKDDVMMWARPEWFPIEIKEKPYIVFIDELNRATREVINSIMPLLLEGTLHTHRLPKGTWIACAMNPDNENYDTVSGFDDRAIWARMCIINVAADAPEWISWLKTNKFTNSDNETLVNELSKQLTSGKNAEMIVQHPNNRSFTKVINLLNYAISLKGTPKAFSVEAIDKACIGILGSGLFGKMKTFIRTTYNTTDIPSIDDILSDVNKDNIAAVVPNLIKVLSMPKPVTSEDMLRILELMKQYKLECPDLVGDLKKKIAELALRSEYREIFRDPKVRTARNEVNT